MAAKTLRKGDAERPGGMMTDGVRPPRIPQVIQDIGVIAGILTAAFGLAEALKTLPPTFVELTPAIRGEIAPLSIDPPYFETTPLFRYSVSLLLVGFIYFAFSYRAMRRELKHQGHRKTSELAAEKQRIEREYFTVVERMGRFVDVLADGRPYPHLNFERVYGEFDINAAGDTTVRVEYTLVAGAERAKFWRSWVFADQTGDGLALPFDNQFRAFARADGTSIDVIPIQNEDRLKKYTISFNPPIEPGNKRAVIITYRWPRFFADLFKKGVSTYETFISSENLNDLAHVCLVFTFTGLDRTVAAELLAGTGGAISSKINGPNSVTWTYLNPTAPMGGKKLGIRFELLPPSGPLSPRRRRRSRE